MTVIEKETIRKRLLLTIHVNHRTDLENRTDNDIKNDVSKKDVCKKITSVRKKFDKIIA